MTEDNDNKEATADAELPEKSSQEEKIPTTTAAKKKRRRKRWPYVLLVIFALIFLLAFSFYEYSNTTQFCNSCHIMKPYYQAWETSTHDFVPCVDCHISPEEGAKWEAKIQGMLQVMKYFTRTYSSKAYAEVEDSSCLRSGCHDQRLVEEYTTEEFKQHVMFDHAPHLQDVRRGKNLRCTSCHAQIVVGNHMEVTTSTCYLCHFKESHIHDVKQLSECRHCHKTIPDKTITHKVTDPGNPDKIIRTVEYNHIDFLGDRQEIDCRVCHIKAVQGAGAAKQDRCFDCHNVPEHLERFGEIEFIHDNHITEHNVSCERCHEAIRHQVQTQSLTLEQSCNRCHVYTHSSQRNIYIGVGGRGVGEVKPSKKYLKMVDCSACHFISDIPAGQVPNLRSHNFDYSEEGCENCHGDNAEEFIDKLDDVMSEVSDLLDYVRDNAVDARKILKSMPEGERKRRLEALLDDADFNIRYVDKAMGWAHNWEYSKLLLTAAEKNITEVKKGRR